MDIIRIFLSSDLRTHDNNLLFNLSGHYCKKTSDSEKFSVSFSKTLQYQKGFSWKISKEHYEKSNLENLFRYPINKKITSNIERSFHWFSLAIIETDYPSKIIKLFTALESILTTIDEKRKAEHIIFRMAFFNYYFEKQFPSPSKIKELYELRSQAVHGSKINGPKFKESTIIINEYHTEYKQLQYQTRRTLNNYIGFINKYSIKKKYVLFEKIEKTHEFSELKDWFMISFPYVAKEMSSLNNNV